MSALPATAESLCAFLADQATLGKRASTLGRRLGAVRYFHRADGHETPTSDEKVKAVLSGIRRTIGAAPVRKRAATADIVIVIAMSPTATSLRARRNRTIILLGFVGAFRRSELVALNVEDLEETAEGMLVTLRKATLTSGPDRPNRRSTAALCNAARAVRCWCSARRAQAKLPRGHTGSQPGAELGTRASCWVALPRSLVELRAAEGPGFGGCATAMKIPGRG